MKKYKVNGMTVKASSMSDAIHQVKDSDILKQMAYKLADMASYFDRANAPHSRTQFQTQEYEKKLTETYTYGLKVYEQLKKEINAMNSSNSIGKGGWRNTETVNLLKDAGHNIYWAAGDVYPRKPHIQAFGRKLEDLANEYQQKLDELHSEYRRNQRNDSEEVEDLATVDKTFLLNLTRKIMSNITSDNFITAQTQAKELERYINNFGYADSVDDSIKDGRTYMNCVLWLERALDDVKGYHSVDAISKLNKVIFWLKNDPNFVDSVDDSIDDARGTNVSGWAFRDNELIKQHDDALKLLNANDLKEGKKQLDYYLHNVRECLDQAVELGDYAKSRQSMYLQMIKDVEKDKLKFGIR